MHSKTKLLVGLFTILAVVLVILVKSDRQKNEKIADFKGDIGSSNKGTVPEKSGDVDAVTVGIIADYSADAQIAQEGDADVEYLNQGLQLMTTQSVYNENDY